MNFILSFVLMLISILPNKAQNPAEILFIKWGEDKNNLNYRVDPDVRFGPQSFEVEGSQIKILDPVNNSLKIFQSGKLFKEYYAPSNAKNFAVKENQKIVYLQGRDLYEYENKKLIKKYINQEKFSSVRDLKVKNNRVYIRNNDGSVQSLGEEKTISLNKKSVSIFPDYKVKISSQNRAEFQFDGPDSRIDIALETTDSKLGAVRYIGKDKNDRFYFDVDLIEQEVPLKVNRQIWITNKSGKKLGIIRLPSHYFTSINDDLDFNKEGIIYHMLSAKEGLYLYKWEIPDRINQTFEGYYPDKFEPELSPNIKSKYESKIDKEEETGLALVSRDTALAIADSYVQHIWNCKEENLTNGVITAPDGDRIRTPEWIQIGENQRIPYKWGGFNTLSEFDTGLENGKYAGDIHTDGNTGSSYARGVDCSGFVSLCWLLDRQHDTSEMVKWDKIQRYYSWDNLKPGDAILRSGHVILFVQHNDDGSLGCVEAAINTTNCRVDYTTHFPKDLIGYSPVYYTNMEGVLPAPTNITIEALNDSSIILTCNPVSNATNYKVFYSTSDSSYSDYVISNNNIIVVSDLENHTPYYFKVIGYNSNSSSMLLAKCYATIISENLNSTLIVNGFDRSSNTRHDYIKKYIQPMLECNQGFSYTLNESVYKGKISLTKYNNVIWMLGDESSIDDTFNPVEQDCVRTFLNNGGNLFISGSEIGWDLEGRPGHPSQADINFYHNYLKAEYLTDAPYDEEGLYYQAECLPNTIFQDSATLEFDNGSQGTINVTWPDAIKGVNGGLNCMKFKDVPINDGVAGIYFAGNFPEARKPGRLVYLTFPFESVYPLESRKKIIEHVFNFFQHPTAIEKNQFTPTVDQFELFQNYPNPFNPSTNISFQLPEAGYVSLSLYDITGRLVRNLIDQSRIPGKYTVSWDASDLSSGMYVYSLKIYRNNNKNKLLYNAHNKCILLK